MTNEIETVPEPSAEPAPEPPPALPLESDEIPPPPEPSALAALNAGEAALEPERAAAARQHMAEQLAALRARLRALTPDARTRLVARLGVSLSDAHAAARLMNDLIRE